MAQDQVSLATLGRGAAIERFDDALEEVVRNILDPNTGLDAREITLKVKMKPHENREACQTTIVCQAKLIGAKSVSTTIYVGQTRDGEITSMEFDPKQSQIEFDAPAKPSTNIQPLNRAMP